MFNVTCKCVSIKFAIKVSMCVAPVRRALSHGDHGNCTAPIKVNLKFFIIIVIVIFDSDMDDGLQDL